MASPSQFTVWWCSIGEHGALFTLVRVLAEPAGDGGDNIFYGAPQREPTGVTRASLALRRIHTLSADESDIEYPRGLS